MRNNSPLYHPLTYDEINVLRASLSAKKFQHDLFRAFLFICETGVSWEDVTLLKWTQIDRESHILFYDYERVNGYQTQRLSQFALNVLPEKNSNKVFSDLHCDFFPNPYGEWQSSDMLAWGQECNIKRRFCLETAGATFVTQMTAQSFDEHEIAKMLNITVLDLRMIYPIRSFSHLWSNGKPAIAQ
ncbi:hypothetical protein U0282_004018 [Salmonella enterica]|jgi:hypothetical protein|nr:hypothetical protein [Salmonella enterica subsp. enterica serovar Montevideo]ECK2477020.1 hypothetical protein [Salmonella enterica subsp. enterica serovar Cerro]EGO1638396.1 hypothetical protein [Salmonella enterica]ELH0844360.1 hypothetical protein [Vibrio cholerae]HAX7424730.1 hypothetical protein [Escherichia coli]HDW2136882.1 hypothetical protein [Yersinia enterocolitica]